MVEHSGLFGVIGFPFAPVDIAILISVPFAVVEYAGEIGGNVHIANETNVENLLPSYSLYP